jgi:hypothetical protein
VISDNITQDSEPGYNLIEHKKCSGLTMIFNYKNGLSPLTKVVYGRNNVLMPPSRSWVAIHNIHPPLSEGTDSIEWMERGWMRVHIPSEHLAGVTLINCFDTIFKNRWPKITGSQNFRCFRKPR